MATKRQLRARLRGADIFERRAIKSAIRALDNGSTISPGVQKTLREAGLGRVVNPDSIKERGSAFTDPDSVFSQVGVVTPRVTSNRGQALFGARQAVRSNNPFSDFQRRELGITDENEDEFRSLLKRRR